MAYRKSNYKDLERWQRTKRNGKKKYYQSTQGYPRKKWTDDENMLIMEHKKSDRELSKQLERSIQSIQTQRWRLKMTDFSNTAL